MTFLKQYDIFYISKGGDYSINLDKYLRKQYKNALSVAYTNNSSVNVLYPKGVMTLEEFKSFVTDDNLLVGCAGPYDSYVINVALNSLNNYKNKNINDAYVSDKHANFIINKGSATGEDIKKLIEEIQDEVEKKYNIKLKAEQEFVE